MASGMFHRSLLLCFPLALSAQSVVSVHSGVVHFLEGSVAIDGKPIEQRFGKFEEIRPGSILSTDQGRAEILLTPGVLLRVDQNSSIRMVSNQLSDTRVAFVGGSMSVDSRNGSPDAPITISFQNYEVRFHGVGCYRFDSAPPRLRIDQGEAEVAQGGKSVSVTGNHVVALTAGLKAGPYVNNVEDGLDRWARERSASVAADNASAATSDTLSADLDNPQNGASGGGYGYGGGGGYSLGVDPALLSPGDLWVANGGLLSSNPWSTAFLYPGLSYGYIFVPVYRHSPLLGYRPYEPIRHGPYLPPGQFHRPYIHTVPVLGRRSVPAVGGAAVHSGVRAAGRH